MTTRQKIKRKCDCGQPVAEGSVFCPNCMAKMQKSNDKVVMRGEKRNHTKISVKWKKKKK